MTIPTEPIGSIPRPAELIEGMQQLAAGRISQDQMGALYDRAICDTIRRFEETGSPIITDGEQTKPSFATYPIHGLETLAPGGVTIPFADGHTRQLPKLAAGPFQYRTYAVTYLEEAKKHARADLLREAERDIRQCLARGAANVQIDFTEGRLAVKLDPSKQLLRSFVDLNARVLDRFTADERSRIGVHTCPGGDHDSTHSADVDYADLLPDLFRLQVRNFYIQLASERNRTRVLRIIKENAKADQRVFVGVTDPIDPRVETPEEVRDRVLEAAEIIPLSQLGTTDDCGFSPFADDTSTARETAFAKIRARVAGTKLAEQALTSTTTAARPRR